MSLWCNKIMNIQILHVKEEVTEKVSRSTDTKKVRQSCNMVWRQMFLFELTRFNNKELFVIQKKKHCTVVFGSCHLSHNTQRQRELQNINNVITNDCHYASINVKPEGGDPCGAQKCGQIRSNIPNLGGDIWSDFLLHRHFKFIVVVAHILQIINVNCQAFLLIPFMLCVIRGK